MQDNRTWTVMNDHYGHGVVTTHHDWTKDPQAVTHPWGVMVHGTIVQRHQTAGDAGSHAQAIADNS